MGEMKGGLSNIFHSARGGASNNYSLIEGGL